MGSRPPERNLLRYATVGIEFLLVFLFFLWLGWQLDRWIEVTRPSVTILGGIVGFSVAMYRLTRQGWGILKTGRFSRRKDDKGGPEGGEGAGPGDDEEQ